ncbi:MAG: hypothetical protein N2038_04730 [Geminicoccaceae bacterium]|nr:hypothetical protein [Geminicoccaceae bacterium]MCS7268469.1 hypothetical protein [Geminicoccaceae bacterium]MCX7629538.1 hypothetical protein [Geminicoccaceae bacterium]MDW8126013.1 hypothetical protein [Geminicoccaceae bacterium]MDW8340869.1 hypothetical protein [Geminicoccaceae bacterium]
MTGSWQLAAFAHLSSAVLLVGYALFWAIMALALARDGQPEEVERRLGVLAAARWPHVLVPLRWRLPLPIVGWLLFAAAAGTGMLAGALSGLQARGPAFWLKIAAVGLLVAVHARLARRPHPVWALAGLPLALVAVVFSVPLLR